MSTWWQELTEQRRNALTVALQHPHAARCLDYARGDREFAAWLLVAEVTCRHDTGLSIFDLADWTWRDAYEDDVPPLDALQDALAADGITSMGFDD